MSRIAKSARPGLQQLRRVGGFARLVDGQVDAGVAVVALLLRRVDARMGGVRGEIEHQRRANGRARFSAATAAAGAAGCEQSGRQQRGNSSHRAGNPSPSAE